MTKYINKMVGLFKEKDTSAIVKLNLNNDKSFIHCKRFKFYIKCSEQKELNKKELFELWDETVKQAMEVNLCPLLVFKQDLGNLIMLFIDGSTVMMFLEDFLSKCQYKN